ncbi:hypothetical protein ACS0TY_012127 [Phlomoides rotata]
MLKIQTCALKVNIHCERCALQKVEGHKNVAKQSNSETVFVPPMGKGTFTVQISKGKDKGKKPIDIPRSNNGYVKPKPKGKAKQSIQDQRNRTQDSVPQGGYWRYYQGKPSVKRKPNLNATYAKRPYKVVTKQVPELNMPKNLRILNPSQDKTRPTAPKPKRNYGKPRPWNNQKVAPTAPKANTHNQFSSKAPGKKKIVYVDVNGRRIRSHETIQVV